MKRISAALLIAGAIVCQGAANAALAATPFADDFSSYALDSCFADGSTFGPWTSAFSGYGCNQVMSDGTDHWLDESPYASLSSSETHASLALGPAFAAPLVLSMNVDTAAQLRKNSPPNPWEVAWVLWDYSDDSHFYYFQPKPNGWELGKEDPAYPGSQRFLASGTSPVFPIGAWYAVRVVQIGNSITVYVDGTMIAAFTDEERPYAAGMIGLYGEDSQARFEDVAVNAPPGTGASAPSPADSARAPQKYLSPSLADGAADAATFGPDAEDVSIYDLRGRRVFHGSRQGGSPIVWNCTDGAGRIEESGVYIAKIQTTGAGVIYQSFALVK
ncbi:MAG TPA: family 16 glycoside hydrolase [Elusimicrobiota bacterium]|jgi:hypothetical protein|nr:family 16 glycoside hydrolase [Elusimicrobiota bacterium]